MVQADNVIQIHEECHPYIYEMNRRGFITIDSQDGMSWPYHERPYVSGFLSKKLWKKFSENMLKQSYVKIVIHRVDKNTRHQKITRQRKHLISLTQDRSRRIRSYITWCHALIFIEELEFEKAMLELNCKENVLYITCIDMRWCSLAKKFSGDDDESFIVSEDAWKHNAIHARECLFVNICNALPAEDSQISVCSA